MNLVLSESKALRIGSMTIFYIAQGLPIGLFQIGMAAWLAANGQPPGVIAALVAAIFLPWSFKFFGAAAMDRYTYLPMGRRRIWLIGSQAAMLAGLAFASFVGPTPDQVSIIYLVGVVIFCGSAMQDVAVDGMAVDILPDEEQGSVSAFTFGGQGLGIAAGGALGGYLLDHYGSSVAFLAFTPLNVFFLLLAVILRERPGEKLLPWTKGQASSAAIERQSKDWVQIVVTTLKSLFRRDSFIMMGGDAFGRAAGGAFTAFWPIFATTRGGWSTAAYSSMVGTVGLFTSLACMFIGSFMVGKLGPRLSSQIAYLGYAIMALVYLAAPELAMIGYVFVLLSIYQNLTDTLTSVCSNPIRMRLCDKRVAATQFTIYNSFANLVVPLGATIYATVEGYGDVVVMPMIIAAILIYIICYAFLRVGGRKEHLETLEPRVD